MPEPIKRARIKDLCGFAGEGNVVERSERYASEAKPEEPTGFKGDERGPCVICSLARWLLTITWRAKSLGNTDPSHG